MGNQYYLNHSKIDVLFKQNKDDFVVKEVPLYEFSGEGEHLIIKFRKKDLTTWDALQIFSEQLGCKIRDVGYAGLKDKNAMTIQYISVNKQYEGNLKNINHPNIKILETTYHNNKIKMGHLKGNKFFIRLKRVTSGDNVKLQSVLEKIAKYGIPNYFGHQRFGLDGLNSQRGKDILDGNLIEKNRKLKQMFINAYQSELFNKWLSTRIEISKIIDSFEPYEISDRLNLSIDEIKKIKKQPHLFKIFEGEVMNHYPYGKLFIIDDTEVEAEATKFNNRDRVATGILSGKKVKVSQKYAYEIEKEFDLKLGVDGARRFAWIWAEELSTDYKEDKNWFELNFYLPKGSYATVMIDQLIH